MIYPKVQYSSEKIRSLNIYDEYSVLIAMSEACEVGVKIHLDFDDFLFIVDESDEVMVTWNSLLKKFSSKSGE